MHNHAMKSSGIPSRKMGIERNSPAEAAIRVTEHFSKYPKTLHNQFLLSLSTHTL